MQCGLLVAKKVSSIEEYVNAMENQEVCELFTGAFPSFLHLAYVLSGPSRCIYCDLQPLMVDPIDFRAACDSPSPCVGVAK